MHVFLVQEGFLGDQTISFHDDPSSFGFPNGGWRTSGAAVNGDDDLFEITFLKGRKTTYKITPGGSNDTNQDGISDFNTYDPETGQYDGFYTQDLNESWGSLANITLQLETETIGIIYGHGQSSGNSETTDGIPNTGPTFTPLTFPKSGSDFQGTLDDFKLYSRPLADHEIIYFRNTEAGPKYLNTSAPLTIAENQPISSIVGDFNATDPDTNATLTYHLVSGVGDGNNSLFTMESNGTLKTASLLDYESGANLSIRVQVKDEYNATSEEVFTINVKDNILDETFALIPSPTWEAGSNFSYSIDVFDNIILVGARYESTNGLYRSGAAYVYRRESNGSITLLDKLTSPSPGENDQFGGCVKLNNQYAFIGAKHADLNGDDNNGGVFVYKFESNGTISFHTRLGPTSGGNSDQYGWSLDVDDDQILVGAHYADANGPNSGEGYLYQLESNGSITLLDNFIGSDTANWDKYGAHVSLDGNHMLIGSYESDPSNPAKSGAAFLNKIEANGTVTELQKITDLPPTLNDRFGERVDLENNLMVIGAPRGDHLGLIDSGYAMVGFLESNGTLTRVAKLSSPNPSADNKFGNDVLINGNFISVLSRGENSIHFWEFDRVQKSTSYKGAVSLSGSPNKFEGTYEIHHTTLYARVVGYDDNGSEHPGKTLVYDLPSWFKRANHFVDLNSSVNLEMIWVEPGTFTMGQVGVAEPVHQVTLNSGFYLGKHEVSQAQYEAVMTGNLSGLSATPSQWPNNPNRPVEKVSWDDAQIFLSRLNTLEANNLPSGWAYVLPTESQWEYACRAGTKTTYSWGNDINSTNANWNHGNDANQTVNVGQYDANPWGFFDMHGNVWEWTADWHAAYSSDAQTDPEGPATGSSRVLRGGAWFNPGTNLRSAYRNSVYTGYSSADIGFRLSFQYTNKPPADLNSTASLTIAENQPVSTTVGEFNATDTEGGAITYHFVNGENNNSLFTLDTNGTLKTATSFDYESNALTYTISVQAKDELNATTEGNFTVTLSNANDPATGTVTISGTAEVGQTLSVSNSLSDPDGIGAITYTWYRDGHPIIYGGTLKDGVNGVDGLDGAERITLSSDGNHAYATGYEDNAVSWYERNASTGALNYGGLLKDGVDGVDGLDSAIGVTLSTDGYHAYVTVGMKCGELVTRNPVTGALTYVGMLKDGVNGVEGLDGAWGVTLSLDGKHAYFTGGNDDAVSWYERNASTGALTYGGMLKDGVNGVDGLDGAKIVSLSSDGDHAYVTSYFDKAVSWYERNASTGSLTYRGMLKDGVDGVDGLDGARIVSLSSDGDHAYVTGQHDDAVSWYERNATTGALNYGGLLKDGVNGVDGLDGARIVSLSSDGDHAYVTSYFDKAVSWYERNASTGSLTYRGMLKDGVDGVDGLDGANSVTLSADGNHAYVTGQDDDAVSWFTRDPVTGALYYGYASGANYTLTEADLGKSITVTASYTDGGSFEHNITSPGTSIIQPPSYTPLTDSNFQTAVNLWFVTKLMQRLLMATSGIGIPRLLLICIRLS